MTQLEKIRKAKGFLQEDVAKASGVNTSTTDVGPKLTVANDSKTENKIINLRESLNTLANDEGEEISQFTQANLDAGIINEDILHIFDDYSNGEENAMDEKPSDEGRQLPQFFQAMIDAGIMTADDLHIFDNPSEVEENAMGEQPSDKGEKSSDKCEGPSDKGEEEPIPQFFQSIIDAGFATADMMHIFDNPSEGEENAMGDEPSDKGEKPSDEGEQPSDEGEQPSDEDEQPSDEGEQPSDKGEEPIPQFFQSMIDNGFITAEELREWNSYLEDEKGEENATDAEGDDGEIENLVNAQTLEKDAEAATEAEDKLMKIINLLSEKEQKKVKTYLTKKTTR